MSKLLRYLKPFLISILVCILLLSGQAWCELTLPDFMQNIVNNGIQNGGIDSGIYQYIRESTLNGYLMVASDEEKKTIESSYELKTVENASKEDVEQVPLLKKENVYFLKEGADTGKLNDTLNLLQLTFVQILQEAQASGKEIPVLIMTNGIENYKEQAIKNMDTLGESTIQSMACQFVKQEYQELGMDMGKIQQSYITVNGIKMLGLALLSAICAIAVGLFSARIGAGISRNLRKDTFEKITSFSLENFQKFSTSTLITRTTNDIQQVQNAIIMMIRIVIYAPIMGIGALIHVLNSNANMTWIIGLTIATIIVIIIFVFILVMPKFKKMQKYIDRMNGAVRELLDGMLVIRAFNNQEVEAQKFDDANRTITDTMLFTTRAIAVLLPLIMLIMNGTMLLILWFGAKQVDAGVIQIGSIMAFMQYSMQVITSFIMITIVSIMLPRANVSAARINEVLEETITITDPETSLEFDESKKGTVVFKDVCFHYPDAQEYVLTDISFETKPGQITAFVGSTGSGKSTLINLVPRFYDVTEGCIEVGGVDIRKVIQE
ncbi:MAG: ABC transporter ATP-binding protein, partial [Holdemanella sp.]|nr:ABC transporter ATP-binding protein [Holdemanella sp.]